MGRYLAQRIIVTGQLVSKSAMHVGGAGDELFSDMPLAQAGDGGYYLPGTSLTGPMRAWWRRAFGNDSCEAIWGPMRQGDKDAGRASVIRIADARLLDQRQAEVREGVGIDRWSGTAAERIKYDRDVLGRDCAFALEMTVEIPARQSGVDDHLKPEFDKLESRLGCLLKALSNGEIRFGAGKSRGLGHLVLDGASGEAKRLRMDKAEEVLKAIQSPSPPDGQTFQGLIDSACKVEIEPNRLDIEVKWTAATPVMMASGRQGILVDTIPMTIGGKDDQRVALTGSGIKGALRTHSERIVRTLMGANPGLPDNDFNSQIEPHKIIGWLYGRKGERDSNANQQRAPGRGALSVEDCLPDLPAISSEQLEEIVSQAPKDNDDKKKAETLRDLLNGNGKCGWKDFHGAVHNAIDRWTGGVADSALYSVLEPPLAGGTIFMSVDLDRLPAQEPDRNAALGLLLLTLRALQDRDIPIGFGVNRGLGSIKVSSIKLVQHGNAIEPPLAGSLDAKNADAFATIGKDWKDFAAELAGGEAVS